MEDISSLRAASSVLHDFEATTVTLPDDAWILIIEHVLRSNYARMALLLLRVCRVFRRAVERVLGGIPVLRSDLVIIVQKSRTVTEVIAPPLPYPAWIHPQRWYFVLCDKKHCAYGGGERLFSDRVGGIMTNVLYASHDECVEELEETKREPPYTKIIYGVCQGCDHSSARIVSVLEYIESELCLRSLCKPLMPDAAAMIYINTRSEYVHHILEWLENCYCYNYVLDSIFITPYMESEVIMVIHKRLTKLEAINMDHMRRTDVHRDHTQRIARLRFVMDIFAESGKWHGQYDRKDNLYCLRRYVQMCHEMDGSHPA